MARTVVSFREVGIGHVFFMGPESDSPFVKTTKSAGVSLNRTNTQNAPITLYPTSRVFVAPAITPYFSTYYERRTYTWWATVKRENGDQIGAAEFSGSKPSTMAQAIDALREMFRADPELFDTLIDYPDETPARERNTVRPSSRPANPAADEVAANAEKVREFQSNPDALRRAIAEHLQTIPGPVLAAMLTGAVSIPDAFKRELASRGLDDDATWIGFKNAREFWGVCE